MLPHRWPRRPRNASLCAVNEHAREASSDDPSPEGGAGHGVREAYQHRLEAIESEAAGLSGRDDALSRARGITFLVAFGATIFALFRSSVGIWTGVGAVWAIFLVFVVLHARLSTRQFDLERKKKLQERALSRLDGTYRSDDPGRRGDALVDDEHPYSSDLDVFGPASLYERLNTTETPGGAERLAAWLRAPAAPAEIRRRQRAVRELAAAFALREDLAMAGMRAGKIDRDATPFLRWAGERPVFHGAVVAVAVALVLVIATLGLLVASSLLPSPFDRGWLVAAGLQIGWLMVHRARIEKVLQPVTIKQSPLGRYAEMMALVEAQKFEDDTLERLRTELRGEVAASVALGRLDRLTGLAAVRHNALIHILADVFLSWDLWNAFLVDRWRAEHGAQVAAWLDTLSELEALVSLATFAYEHPDYAWPELAGTTCFSAQRLGHPLIAPQQRVENDLDLGESPAVLMITGSNMSGKSTMLRSMGVAAVLAQAGAPVCARRLRLSALDVHTSMRVGDALDRGASRFYMEVQKLKAVVEAMDALPAGRGLLFLLDEVLHGTNSRERNIGAKAVVRHLVDRGALGAVSSHDLGLVELEALTAGRVKNVHFEDHLEGGKMAFDYRMKDGAVSTSNALRLMRQVGIAVAGLEDGDQGQPAGSVPG
jgi:hypothetical protein